MSSPNDPRAPDPGSGSPARRLAGTSPRRVGAGLAVTAVLFVAVIAWWEPRSPTGRVVAKLPWPELVVLVLVVVGAGLMLSPSRHHRVTDAPRRPELSRWWALLGFALMIAVVWTASVLLLAIAEGSSAPLQPGLRIEAIKTGLATGAAVGGAGALLLSMRKQWLSEQTLNLERDVAAGNEKDATERRTAELYGRAVDQLGNEKAAVRMGGVYALEQLGQNYGEYRPVVIKLVCAYLRMPYRFEERGPSAGGPERDPGSLDELQVRSAAQRVISDHLAWPGPDPEPPTHWADIDVDLTGATLVDFDFAGCRARSARFAEAVFHRAARFSHSAFSRTVDFTGARFGGRAEFTGAAFSEAALFKDAVFDDAVLFDANPGGRVGLRGAAVSRCRAGHRLPRGWRVQADEAGPAGLLVDEDP